TRRRRFPPAPPPRGRSGRFGLLPPLAMSPVSVKADQFRADADGLPQHPWEGARGARPLEAARVAARVDAAAGHGPARDEGSVAGSEPHELRLLCAPAAAGAAPDRRYSSPPSAEG